jgi:hypothetical protein
MLTEEWQNILNRLDKVRNRLGCTDPGSAWYRGHASKTYRLVPSLLRKPRERDGESSLYEHNLYCQCVVRARGFIREADSSWERLATFQHFGIPTRLLDWTDSFAVAVFFASTHSTSRSHASDGDAHIWVLNPFKLNRRYFTPPRIATVGVDQIPDYFKSFIEYDNPTTWLYDSPLAVEIPWANRRIESQRGYFTVHPDAVPLDEAVGKSCAMRIDIPLAALADARKFCELAGLDEYSIFPDLHGLGTYLRATLER